MGETGEIYDIEVICNNTSTDPTLNPTADPTKKHKCTDEYNPVCCDKKNQYRNICLAQCAGEKEKKCVEKQCDNGYNGYSAYYQIENQEIDGTNMGITGLLNEYELNINTILLALILISIIVFICIYHKRTNRIKFVINE